MINEDQDSSSKQTERPFINGDRAIIPTPERHGCVTAWLILMLVGNSLGALAYIIFEHLMEQKLKVSSVTIAMIILLSVLNAFFAINFCIKFPIIPSTLGLSGIGILYSILQIKKTGRPAWFYLK